jgi:hypothetical protein
MAVQAEISKVRQIEMNLKKLFMQMLTGFLSFYLRLSYLSAIEFQE